MRTNARVTAFTLYMSTCRKAMQLDCNSLESTDELKLYLPYLRQAISCCVCGKVIENAMGHTESTCLHVVCKSCIGGKMNLKPSCSWCKDWSKFTENVELRIIVNCYHKLCAFLSTTPMIEQLRKQSINGSTDALVGIIDESVGYLDQKLLTVAPSPVRKTAPQEVTQDTIVKQCEPLDPLVSTHPEVVASDTKSDQNVTLTDSDKTTSQLPQNLSPELKVTPERIRHRSSSRRKVSTSSFTSTANISPPPKITRSSPAALTLDNSFEVDISHTITQTVQAEHDYTSQKKHIHDSPPFLGTVKSEPGAKNFHAEISNRTHNYSSKTGKKRGRASHGSTYKAAPHPTEKKPRVKSSKKVQLDGCRCGLATPNPGKLTCCGQRCPCYASFKGCTVNCRCRGCRNSRKSPGVEQNSILKSEHLLSSMFSSEIITDL